MVEISETAKLNSYVTERLRRLLEAAGTELESGVDFAVRILQSVQAAPALCPVLAVYPQRDYYATLAGLLRAYCASTARRRF